MGKNKKTIPGLREQWSNFFKLIKRARVPWYLYILTFIMDALRSTLFIKLPVLLGEIMQGEIFDMGKVAQYGLLSTCSTIFGFCSVFLFGWITMKLSIATGTGVWGRVLRLPMHRLDQEGPSHLTSRVTRDTEAIDLAISGIFNLLSTLYAFVLLFVEMFKMHTGLSAVLLAVPFLVAIGMAVIGGMSYQAQRQVTDAMAKLTAFLSVRLPNFRLIKAFATHIQEQIKGAERIEEQYQAEMRVVWVNIAASLLQEIASAMTNIVVIVYGSYLVGTGRLELGSFVTFFLFVTQGNFLFNAQMLMMYYQNIKFGMGGCGKIAELMDAEEEKLEREKSFTVPEADIVFDHVSFSYGEKPVLRDLNMTIPKGKVTAIVGPNGSGKTTVLKLLERLYTPDSGRITYGGEDIERYHLTDWRGSIGYVVQNSPLLIGTVTDNICYGMTAPDRGSAQAAAREVGADAFIREMEQGYDSPVGELGGKLSGGQRQKLAIARALAKKPDMYLLDEATCGLDACSEQELTEFMSNFLRDKTAVIVAHNLDTIRMADQIIVLQDGQVNGAGSHAELLETSELYRNFCGINA